MPQSRKQSQVQILLVSSGMFIKRTRSLVRSAHKIHSQYSSADHYRKARLSKQHIKESQLVLFSLKSSPSFHDFQWILFIKMQVVFGLQRTWKFSDWMEIHLACCQSSDKSCSVTDEITCNSVLWSTYFIRNVSHAFFLGIKWKERRRKEKYHHK